MIIQYTLHISCLQQLFLLQNIKEKNWLNFVYNVVGSINFQLSTKTSNLL